MRRRIDGGCRGYRGAWIALAVAAAGLLAPGAARAESAARDVGVAPPRKDAGPAKKEAGVRLDSGEADFNLTYETNCTDGKDNDGDGQIDCADHNCWLQPCGDGCLCRAGRKEEFSCFDRKDNDGDGQIDCADVDCQGKTGCLRPRFDAGGRAPGAANDGGGSCAVAGGPAAGLTALALLLLVAARRRR